MEKTECSPPASGSLVIPGDMYWRLDERIHCVHYDCKISNPTRRFVLENIFSAVDPVCTFCRICEGTADREGLFGAHWLLEGKGGRALFCPEVKRATREVNDEFCALCGEVLMML